jgi:hypothetical protein
MMFTGVPNLAWVFGYVVHVIQQTADKVALREEDGDMPILPWIEEDNFNPSYLTRDMDKLPQRGAKPEWRHNQDYWREKDEIPATDLNGSEFIYDGVRRDGNNEGLEVQSA